MGLQLDLLKIDGTGHLAKLPKATEVATMDELNGDGQLTFKVAAKSVGADALLGATEALVQVSLDGEPVAHGVLDRDGDDPTAGGSRAITVTAPGTAVLLADAIVYGDTAGATSRSFTTATPGFVLGTLLHEGQGRGAMAGVSWTFTDAVDSAGVAWPQRWTAAVEVGTTVRAVLANLVAQRLVDFRMVGLRLEVYVADTALKRDRPEVHLLAQWLTEGERERTRQGKVTHMLGLGDGGRTATAASAEPGRRREAMTQLGGIPDQGTLQLATEAALAPVSKVQEGYTTGYLLTPQSKRPRPWADYRPGDSIRRGDIRVPTGELEPLRVTSMSVSLNDDGATAVTLELNDVFLEAEVANKLRLDALTNGSVIGQPSAQYGVDTMKPAPPASVQVTSDTYTTGYGTLAAQATASWPQVTTNADGTPTSDVAGYEVQWNVSGDGFGTAIDRTTAQQISRDALPLGGDFFEPANVQVRVRTVDTTGNYSDWQVSAVVALARDTTAPPKPSAPVVTSQLGLITVGWDGKAYDGSAMPPDTAVAEVWQSSDAGFTVGAANSSLVGQLRAGGGELAIRGTTYGAQVYVKLRPVDNSRNYGPVSDERAGARQWVVGPDVFEGAIGTSKLADLAVTNAKINDLAVNTGKIADLSVGSGKIIDLVVDKLTGGYFNAGVILTGHIVAGDPFGARVALYNDGLKAYNSLGQETVRIIPDQVSLEVGTAGGPRARLSTAANVFQSGQQWGMLEFFSGNGLWEPGRLWASYDASGTQGELKLTSPFRTAYGFGGAASLVLSADANGGKRLRTDADSFLFGSGGTSVDFRLQFTNQFQVLNPSGIAFNIGFGDPGTGFGATALVAKNADGSLRQMIYRANSHVWAPGDARNLQLGSNFDAPASPILLDSGADVGISTRNVNGGQLDVVGSFGSNYKWVKCWSVNSVSDVSWKAHIRDVPTADALEQIVGLRPREYSVKGFDPKRRTRGLVAQEVQRVLPLAAVGEDGDMGVDHYVLITTLVGATQELAARVAELEAAAQ